MGNIINRAAEAVKDTLRRVIVFGKADDSRAASKSAAPRMMKNRRWLQPGAAPLLLQKRRVVLVGRVRALFACCSASP